MKNLKHVKDFNQLFENWKQLVDMNDIKNFKISCEQKIPFKNIYSGKLFIEFTQNKMNYVFFLNRVTKTTNVNDYIENELSISMAEFERNTINLKIENELNFNELKDQIEKTFGVKVQNIYVYK